MSKKTEQKASFADLVARKAQKDAEQYKTKDIYIPCLDRTLTFHKPPQKEMYRLLDELDTGSVEKAIAGAVRVIYHCCKMLQDPELHKELGIVDPYDIVESLIDITDINMLGDELAVFTGMARLEENIKN